MKTGTDEKIREPASRVSVSPGNVIEGERITLNQSSSLSDEGSGVRQNSMFGAARRASCMQFENGSNDATMRAGTEEASGDVKVDDRKVTIG
jgi:hypothetical protein